MDYSADFEQLLTSLLINTLFTIVIYLAIPVILRYGLKKRYCKKEAKKIATWNAVSIFILISLYYIIVLNVGKVANAAPAFLWGGLGYLLLLDKNKTEKNKSGARRYNTKCNGINNKTNYSLTNNNNISGDDIAVKDMLVKDRNPKLDSFYNQHDNYRFNESERKNSTEDGTFVTFLKAIAIVIIISLVVGIISLFVLEYSRKIDELNNQISSLEAQKDDLYHENSQLFIKNISNGVAVEFWDNYGAIVPVGSKTYHKYSCSYCNRDKFYIYGKNEAIARGYTACPYCQ